MTKNVENVYILLTTLSIIFDNKTFEIHRDTIAKLIHTDNFLITNFMKSLKGKHGVIDFNMTDEKEYTVTLIKPSQYTYDKVMKHSKEYIKRMDEENLYNYKKLLEYKKMREDGKNHECLERFLEEKRKEQIENANKTEMVLKEIFDKHRINYDYQHIEIIKDNEGKEHGYIYDFLVDFNGHKYDVEIDGSSHDGKEESDKERDNLTRSIGIEPIRFSTNMVYTIADEDNNGRLHYGVIAILIRLDFSSIGKMLDNWFKLNSECRCEKDENKRLEDENKKLQDLLEVKTIQLSEANNTISQIESILKKSNNEIDSLFGEKERQRKVRDEMARECFLLSKNDVGKVSE